MIHPTSRRQFLKATALASAAVPVLISGSSSAKGNDDTKWQLENDFFRVAFDVASGEFDIQRRDGSDLTTRARVVRPDSCRPAFFQRPGSYTEVLQTVSVNTKWLEGKQLVARCLDGRKQLDLELQITLPNQAGLLVIEVVCRNVSREPLIVEGIEPIRARADEAGSCFWPATSKILTNGQMYYDAGKVRDFVPGKEMHSWWNAAFFAGGNRQGLVAGYLENKSSRGQLNIKPVIPKGGVSSAGTFSFTADSSFQPGFVLQPGASVSSDRFAFIVAPDPFRALESLQLSVDCTTFGSTGRSTAGAVGFRSSATLPRTRFCAAPSSPPKI